MLKTMLLTGGVFKVLAIYLFALFFVHANAAAIITDKTMSNKGNKGLIAAFPDVCFTPPEHPVGPIPIPYPNMPNVQAYKAILTPSGGRKELWIPVSLGRKQTVSFRGVKYQSTRKIVLEDEKSRKPVSGFQSSYSINPKCRSGNKCVSLTVEMTPPAGLPVGKYGLKLVGVKGQLLAEFIFSVSSSSKTTGKKQVKENPASSVAPKQQIEQQVSPDLTPLR